MNDTEIKLAPWEIMIAAQAGLMRQVENLKLGRKHAHGAKDKNSWRMHIEGAIGEYVLAKHLNVHWSGKGKLRAPDVGEVDVRTTSMINGDLILHPGDPDDRVFWLVCGGNARYFVRGWILAVEGKNQDYWRDPYGGRPAYFVPSAILNKQTM